MEVYMADDEATFTPLVRAITEAAGFRTCKGCGGCVSPSFGFSANRGSLTARWNRYCSPACREAHT